MQLMHIKATNRKI